MPAREPSLNEPRGTLLTRTGIDPEPQTVAVMVRLYNENINAITVRTFSHRYHSPDYAMYANRYRVVEDEDAAR